MRILNLQQGSPEWHEARAKHFTASEAPAMLGVSKYTSRTELLRQKATGLVEEVSTAQQAIFDRGHEAEALARPHVEAIIGEELFPSTGTLEVEGLPLLASFDGITMLEDVVWENKLLNRELVAEVEADDLEPHYWAQLEQQLLVSGAERAIFTTSDGTEDRTHFTWYTSIPERREQLIAGWKQFAEDLANYQHVETKAETVGRTPESLPALRIEINGGVTASNLAEYKERAQAVFDGINTDLQTDNDFADAAETVKWCKQIEEKLKATKEHALAQTADIEEVFRTLDDISEQARVKRLELDKLVKARKQAIRDDILFEAKQAMADHIKGINDTLGAVTLPSVPADFAGAMKGKKTLASLRDAADTELANAKINANQMADGIRINLKALEDLAGEHRFLFHDLQQLVTKPADDFAALVKVRIAEHQQAEQRRREEEEARAKAEAEKEEHIQTHSPSQGEPGYQEPVSEQSPSPATSPLQNNPAGDAKPQHRQRVRQPENLTELYDEIVGQLEKTDTVTLVLHDGDSLHELLASIKSGIEAAQQLNMVA